MLELGNAFLCRLPFDGDRGDPPAQCGFEAVSVSLRVPIWRTVLRMTVPICLPATLEVTVYVLVNVMTTVSAQILFYGPTPSRHRSRSCAWTKPARRARPWRWR